MLHCFPINGLPQTPEVYGLPGIMNAYRNIIYNVELSGPTLFNPIITETMKLAQLNKNAGNQYIILLILTDGAIHDMEATKNSIVKAAGLPLSIIIVGIGNENFANMEILDGDNGLYDTNGNRAQRDLVQFVPFKKFQSNGIQLAKEVLAELPDQVVQYHQLIGKRPNPPQMVQMSEIQVQNTSQPTVNFTANLAKGGFMQQFINPPLVNQ